MVCAGWRSQLVDQGEGGVGIVTCCRGGARNLLPRWGRFMSEACRQQMIDTLEKVADGDYHQVSDTT